MPRLRRRDAVIFWDSAAIIQVDTETQAATVSGGTGVTDTAITTTAQETAAEASTAPATTSEPMSLYPIPMYWETRALMAL